MGKLRSDIGKKNPLVEGPTEFHVCLAEGRPISTEVSKERAIDRLH